MSRRFKENMRTGKAYPQLWFKAKQDGLNVNGYLVLSITNNFEWAEGYFPCFGLIVCVL